MSILITGGTGFLGRHLARHLVERGEGPIVLFSRSPKRQAVADIADKVEVVSGDCAEYTELLRVVKAHSVTDIFHMAGFVGQADRVPAETIRVNLVSTNNVFEAAMFAGVRKVVWASTAAVYPSVLTRPDPVVLDESTPVEPHSIYAAGKLWCECLAENYRQRYGFDHVAIRPTSVFGVGRSERLGETRSVYTDMVEVLLAGKRYTMPPRDHKLMWAYARDCAEAFYCAWKARRLQHRVFLFGGEVCSAGETVDFLRSLAPNIDVAFGPEPARIVPMVNTALLEKETGYRPRYGMREGIRHYVGELREAAA